MGPFLTVIVIVIRLSLQLFHSLNEYAEECRVKATTRARSLLSTSNRTGTVLETAIRNLRLPSYVHNKLVTELDRSRAYTFEETDVKVDGHKRWRTFKVRKA